MEFIGFGQAYASYGASSIFSPVADLLQVRLTNDYGKAVEAIYFTAFLKSSNQKPRPTLEEHFHRFHGFLDKLPKVVFRRKLKRIEIQYLSREFVADDDESNKLVPENCHKAAKEVKEALALIANRIKPTDDFDVKRFLEDAAQALSSNLSIEDWEKVRQEAKAQKMALRDSKSPWELLEIEWKRFHPNARKILDDTYFWESASDLSPNGNDTGADLLADFQRWNKRNGDKHPFIFLVKLLEIWQITPIDWNVTDEAEVRKLDKEQHIPLSLCNEAIIALAFAAIKLRGCCPPDLAQKALNALVRTAILVKGSTLNAEVKSAWSEAITKMRTKLEQVQHD